MIDETAFFNLSYGLYVIGAKDGQRRAGCIANAFQQITASPIQVSVVLNKDNATTSAILASGRFTVSCLAKDATMETIGMFGFHSSNDTDKFATCATATDAAGVPYVAEQCVAHFSASVTQTLDVGTHILFVGDVEEAEKMDAGEPMTYAYYHQVKGGKTPPKATSYLPDIPDAMPATEGAPKPKYAWRCTVCGHMEYVDELPDDFVCPICSMGKNMFERVEL